MDIENHAASHLECGSHRGQNLREPGHGALKGHRKNTTVRAGDLGKVDRLLWRWERPDSNVSIRRLRSCYVSGHNTIDLRRGRYVLAVALSAGFQGSRRSPPRVLRRQSTYVEEHEEGTIFP